MQRVQGHCPMGCGETLFLGEGGHVTCSYINCPRPTAVDELLADSETEHIVVIGEETFSIQHPLRERLDGELHDCALHLDLSLARDYVAAQKVGVYRAHRCAEPEIRDGEY